MTIMLHFCIILYSMYLTNTIVYSQTFLTLQIKVEKPSSVALKKNFYCANKHLRCEM